MEEINQFLIVYLQHWAGKFAFIWFLLPFCEYIVKGTWNNAILLLFLEISEHCVSLAWPSLPICEDGWVAAWEELVDVPPSDCFIDFFLAGELPKDRVEAIAVLTVIDHSTIIFDAAGCFNARSEPAIHSNVWLFLSCLALVVCLLLKCGFGHRLR